MDRQNRGRWLNSPWFVVLFAVVCCISFLYLDAPVARFFHTLAWKTRFPMLSWLAISGESSLYVVLLGLLALFFRFRGNFVQAQRAWFAWWCVFFPSFVCLGLKMICGRARPALLFQENLFGFYGPHTSHLFWSFPSGHTTTMVGLMFALIALMPKQRFVWIVAAVLLVLMRVVLTAHYLSDVLVSSYLTWLELQLMCGVMRRRGWMQTVLQPV